MNRFSIICMLLCVLQSGCVGMGSRVDSRNFLAREPVLGAILADLAVNDRAIEDFRGEGHLRWNLLNSRRDVVFGAVSNFAVLRISMYKVTIG